MPIYEYRCGACGHELDALQKMTDGPLRKCPECGKSQLRRLVSAPSFRLKGGGWYETDFKRDGEKKRNLVETAGAESGNAGASDAAASKDSAAKDSSAADASKPAAKSSDDAAKKPKPAKAPAQDTKKAAKSAGAKKSARA
jgi:putative FmdB family regulatory protein